MVNVLRTCAAFSRQLLENTAFLTLLRANGSPPRFWLFLTVAGLERGVPLLWGDWASCVAADFSVSVLTDPVADTLQCAPLPSLRPPLTLAVDVRRP